MNTTEIIPMRNALRKGGAKSFLLFSDSHGEFNTSVKRVVDVANDWGASYVDAIINCGDTVASLYSANAISGYYSQLARCDIDVLTAVGNHDAWVGDFHKWDTNANIDANFGSKIDTYASKFGDTAPTHGYTDSCYYYKDYGDVRVIVVNAVDARTNRTQYPVGTAYTGLIYWDAAQKAWLENTLADAKTNRKHVLMVCHFFFDTDKMSPWDYANTKAYKKATEQFPWTSSRAFEYSPKSVYKEGWLPDEVVLCVKNFMDAGGTLVGWLAGHTHYDMWWGIKDELVDTYGKQMMFTTGSAKSSNITDLETDTENYLFNNVMVDTTRKVMTIMRIGAGCDFFGRERRVLVWDYDNKVLLRY